MIDNQLQSDYYPVMNKRPYLLICLLVVLVIVIGLALYSHYTPIEASPDTLCGLTPVATCNYTYDMRGVKIDLNQPGLTNKR